jgi:hypothetical protein
METKSKQKPEGQTYRVVGVLSPSRIVLNCGSDQGVSFGDVFKVYAYGAEMKDIETSENLGRVYLPRGRGEVRVLQRKICTIESQKRPNMYFQIAGVSNDPLPFDDAVVGDYAEIVTDESS